VAGKGSWHDQYKGPSTLHALLLLSCFRCHHLPLLIWTSLDSAYVFVGGLAYELTEGDVITIFSQYVSPSQRIQSIIILIPPDEQMGRDSGHQPPPR